MERFKIKCDDFVFEIECKYTFSKKCCANYIVDDGCKTDLKIVPDDKSISMVKDFLKGEREEYIEFIAIYYLISHNIFKFNALFMHGAAICVNDTGVVFAAPSGTGKTTHILQWLKEFGSKVTVINGDKPLLIAKNNLFYISGTPWCGKERLSVNKSVPLKAICFLERSESNSIEVVEKKDVLSKVIKELFLPEVGSDSMGIFFGLIDFMIKNIDFYLLKCNISTEAAKVAYNGIFGSEDLNEG